MPGATDCDAGYWRDVGTIRAPSCEDSVLLHGVDVGRGAIIRRAILDKNVKVPPGARFGVNADEDRARGFTFSDNGIVVVGKDDPVRL